MGYDAQKRNTTTRTIYDDLEFEVKHQYGKDEIILTSVYKDGELESSTSYIYYSDGDYMANKTENGIITSTVEFATISDTQVNEVINNLEFDEVILINKTFDEHENITQEIVSMDDKKMTRVAYTYDQHNNRTSLKRFEVVNEVEKLIDFYESSYEYDEHDNMIKQEDFNEGTFNFVTIRTITYKE